MSEGGRFLQRFYFRLVNRELLFKWLAFVLLLTGAAGCSSPVGNFSRIVNEPAPLPADLRASFGTVGLLPGSFTPEQFFDYPEAAVRDTSHDNDGDWSFGDKLVIISGDLLIELLAPGEFGPRYEVLEGAPGKSLTEALRQNPMQKGVQTCLCELALQLKSHKLFAIPESQLSGLYVQGETNRSPRSLAGKGMDSVLLVRIVRQRFTLLGRVNLNMIFSADADVRLIRVADGSMLYAGILTFESGKRAFSEWGRDDASLLRSEMKLAQKLFAEAVMEQLFDVDVNGKRKDL